MSATDKIREEFSRRGGQIVPRKGVQLPLDYAPRNPNDPKPWVARGPFESNDERYSGTEVVLLSHKEVKQ